MNNKILLDESTQIWRENFAIIGLITQHGEYERQNLSTIR